MSNLYWFWKKAVQSMFTRKGLRLRKRPWKLLFDFILYSTAIKLGVYNFPV